MDNIGGITEASYCFATDVQSCAVLMNGILISLTNRKNWKDFEASSGKIDITVTPTDANGVTLYTVAGTIWIPKIRELTFCEQIQFKSRRILIKYVTANGDILVVGDKENSIKVLVENVTPTTASGYCGQKITLSGTMKHSELPLL